MTKALISVDIQNDYLVGGGFPLPSMTQCVQNAAKALTFARLQGWRIVHIRHEELDPAGGFLLPGTDGAAIAETVAPRPGETIVTKNFPNSFRKTDLRDVLDGVSEVYIVGAMSNMCIDATARAAVDLGFSTTIIEDACAASDLEFHGEVIPARIVHGAFISAFASAYGSVTAISEVLRGS